MEGAVRQRPGGTSTPADILPALHKAASAIGTYFQQVSSGWKPFDVVMDKATQLLLSLLDPAHPPQTLLTEGPPRQLRGLAAGLLSCSFNQVADICEVEASQGVPKDKVAFALAGAVQKAAAALTVAAQEAEWKARSSNQAEGSQSIDSEEEGEEGGGELQRVPSTSDVSVLSGPTDSVQLHSRRSSMSGALSVEGSAGPSPSDTAPHGDAAGRPPSSASAELRDKLKQAAHDVAHYFSSAAAKTATFEVVRQRVQGEVWFALDPSKKLRSGGQPQQLVRMAKALRGLLGEVPGLVEEGCSAFDAREVHKVVYCLRGALPEAVSLLVSTAAKAMAALQDEMAALSSF